MFNKHQLFGLFFLGSIFTSPSIAVPAIAVGDYAGGDSLYPLIASSQDDGLTWSYKITKASPKLPANFTYGGFESSSCSKDSCVVIGQYTTNTFKGFPLFAFTNDGGLNWSYVLDGNSSVLPKNTTSASFRTVSCTGLNCVAGGSFTTKTKSSSIIIHSQNGGKNWSRCSLLPYSANAVYTASSCSTQTCVMVGEYANELLAIYSKNGGQTWSYGSQLNGPTDSKGGAFRAASCSGLNCNAVGFYGINEFSYSYPVIANSKDGGKNWTVVVDSKTPALPSEFQRAGFAAVSCSTENCVAVGDYHSSTVIDSPFIAHSKDSGQTWSYVWNDSIANLPANYNNGNFSDVNCSKSSCIAVGQYYDDRNSYPLIAYSKDGGASWAYSVDSTTPKLPDDFTSGSLTKVSCSGAKCISTGTYFHEGPYLPLLARSDDAGVTWTYAINGSVPALPEGSNGARFASSEISKTFKALGLK